MGKTSTSELIKKIVLSLSQGEKSINELATEIPATWESVRDHLETLKAANILEEREEGGKRIFTVKERATWRNDTYFGLPLDLEKEKLIKGIYYQIKIKWERIKNKPITQTQAQKILFRTNKKLKLGIPLGWYLSGEVSTLPFDHSADYSGFTITKKIEEELNPIIEKTAKDQFAYETKNKHYAEEQNPTYLKKELILKLLYSSTFTKKSVKRIKDHLLEIVGTELSKLDKDTDEIIQAYFDLLYDIPTRLEEEQIQIHKREIILSFEALWKLIALQIYKNDLKQFYDTNILEQHFIPGIEQQKKEAIDLGTELQNLIPPDEEPQDEEYLKIKELLNQDRKIDIQNINRLEPDPNKKRITILNN